MIGWLGVNHPVSWLVGLLANGKAVCLSGLINGLEALATAPPSLTSSLKRRGALSLQTRWKRRWGPVGGPQLPPPTPRQGSWLSLRIPGMGTWLPTSLPWVRRGLMWQGLTGWDLRGRGHNSTLPTTPPMAAPGEPKPGQPVAKADHSHTSILIGCLVAIILLLLGVIFLILWRQYWKKILGKVSRVVGSTGRNWAP